MHAKNENGKTQLKFIWKEKKTENETYFGHRTSLAWALATAGS